MRKRSSKLNGRKGGRPKGNNKNPFELPEFSFVILTENEYKTLLEKYGYKLINKALCILENWLESSPEGWKYRGKNNYAHFRSDGWLINLAKLETSK